MSSILGESYAGSPHPIEVELKRRDHAAIKVRLSGREISDEYDDLEGSVLSIEGLT